MLISSLHPAMPAASDPTLPRIVTPLNELLSKVRGVAELTKALEQNFSFTPSDFYVLYEKAEEHRVARGNSADHTIEGTFVMSYLAQRLQEKGREEAALLVRKLIPPYQEAGMAMTYDEQNRLADGVYAKLDELNQLPGASEIKRIWNEAGASLVAALEEAEKLPEGLEKPGFALSDPAWQSFPKGGWMRHHMAHAFQGLLYAIQ